MDDQSFFTQNLFNPNDSFIKNALPDNLSSSSSSSTSISPNPLISSILSTIELEQIQQSRDCLEASASYMQDIELFFRDLSTNSTSSTLTTQPTTPVSAIDTLASCLANFDPRDLDNFNFDPSNNISNSIVFNPSSIIDPSIFNLKCPSDDEESADELDESIMFNLYNWEDPYESNMNCSASKMRPHRKSFVAKNSNNSSSSFSPSNSVDSSSTTSSTPKTPKFYSRSGQVADPRRGPCHNCHTTLTCYWRKLKGQYHCNACTLYYKRNKCHRSGDDLGDKPIKRRNRKSKYSS